MKAHINWTGGMSFDSVIRDHHFTIDARTEHGGENKGPNPKEVMLSSICGCTGMDVVSLMKKMRVEFESFSVSAEAETTETHPKIFKQVDLVFSVTGVDPDLSKIKKSVEMSLTKYCGISAMVSKASPIFYKIVINSELKDQGEAKF